MLAIYDYLRIYFIISPCVPILHILGDFSISFSVPPSPIFNAPFETLGQDWICSYLLIYGAVIKWKIGNLVQCFSYPKHIDFPQQTVNDYQKVNYHMSLALAATPSMSFDFQVRYDRPHDQILTWFIDGVLVPLIHFSSLIDRYLQQLVEYEKWYTQLGRRVMFQDLISRRMPATSAAFLRTKHVTKDTFRRRTKKKAVGQRRCLARFGIQKIWNENRGC